MFDSRAYESMLLEDLGCAAPTDKELRRILFRAKNGRNPERNELIFFLQLNGFRISETAQILVEHAMWPDGTWKDVVSLPAKICKNKKANHLLFVNDRLREAADNYVDLRLKKRIRITADSDLFRGLQPHSPLVLAEGGRAYSLKKKTRLSVDGETLEYWAADTLQNQFSEWCRKAGLDSKLSSHCGRKAFASRLSWHPVTGIPRVIAVLLRHMHSDEEMPFKYIKESGKAERFLCERFDQLGGC